MYVFLLLICAVAAMLHVDPEEFTGPPVVEPGVAGVHLQGGLPPRPMLQPPGGSSDQGEDSGSRDQPSPPSATSLQHSDARIDILSQEIAALREDLEALKGST